MLLVSVLVSSFVFVVCDEGTSDAALRFYFRNIDEFKELPLERSSDIMRTSWYDPLKDTVIFAHGFTGVPEGAAVQSVITAYLEQGSNVALLNWQHLAAANQPSLASSYMRWAAPNARKLGIKFVTTLLSLQESGLNLTTTHLVGHSLGAQLFGITGNNLMAKGTPLPWITGLDPASIGFENRPNNVKIHGGSAEYVDLIHSDPSKYGYKKSMGTVDFWPNFKNGQVIQPGCPTGGQQMFSQEGDLAYLLGFNDLCSHNRCWQYLVDSLRQHGSIIGCHARNFRIWKNYSDTERKSTTLILGSRVLNCMPGDYFFRTKESSPFGLGEDGL